MRASDPLTVLLLALSAAIPALAASPASFGLSPVIGAWVGLAGLVVGVLLNRQDTVGDGE